MNYPNRRHYRSSGAAGSDKSSGNKSSDTKTVMSDTTTDKPDLLATLQEKDRKNREEALQKVIDEAKDLIRNTDIPPVAITPFEEALLNFVMLEHLDQRHYDVFGIIEGQSMTEDIRLGLYTKLTEEQKNMLKRDFLIKHTVRITGISKRTALLIELAKLHFPDEMAVAEHTQNEEYEKKLKVINEQIDKINSKNEELQEVA
jgi:ParB family chromosome partitioning protein